MSSKTCIQDVRLLVPKSTSSNGGKLSFFEDPTVQIVRIFKIDAFKGTIRGEHAHKQCSQWLWVTQGKIHISFDDAISISRIHLTEADGILFVPPGIWLKLLFCEDSSISILADRVYEESDYIRNRQKFLKYKGVT